MRSNTDELTFYTPPQHTNTVGAAPMCESLCLAVMRAATQGYGPGPSSSSPLDLLSTVVTTDAAASAPPANQVTWTLLRAPDSPPR
jgi:hypothetical protein